MKYNPITKSTANKLIVNSLFNGNKGTLSPCKLDSGRYVWLGSQQAHIEHLKKNNECCTKGKLIWFERRTDHNGNAYCQIMTFFD